MAREMSWDPRRREKRTDPYPARPQPEQLEEWTEDALADISFRYYAQSSEENPNSGLEVEVGGGSATIHEWMVADEPDDEAHRESYRTWPVSKRSASVDLVVLLNPTNRQRGSYSRDDSRVGAIDVARMNPDAQQEAIVNAAISWLAYYGGDEEWVESVGD